MRQPENDEGHKLRTFKVPVRVTRFGRESQKVERFKAGDVISLKYRAPHDCDVVPPLPEIRELSEAIIIGDIVAMNEHDVFFTVSFVGEGRTTPQRKTIRVCDVVAIGIGCAEPVVMLPSASVAA